MMKLQIKLFCHSILSDWNHGNAHFLRGVVTELVARGHDVECLEPAGSWSRLNLAESEGLQFMHDFGQYYPLIRWKIFDSTAPVEDLIGDAGLVIVHEWNSPELIEALGQCRRKSNSMRLFFHDTHHRALTAPFKSQLKNLANYDAVLAYGESLREIYAANGWGNNVCVWHEAADTNLFKPLPNVPRTKDLAWIGNWGDDERTPELEEFLVGPAERLRLVSEAYGVRYPKEAIARLEQAGFVFKGWLPNYLAPAVFARHRVTVHVPRRPYTAALPGIPTIRPFEAMACGIPLICARWHDNEGLFREGQDYLVAQSGAECEEFLRLILNDEALSRQLSASGLETIRNRHTCKHRVDELLSIYDKLSAEPDKHEEMELCS